MRMKPARPSAALSKREKEIRLAEIAYHLEEGEVDEALERLNEFLNVYPDEKMAHMLRASAYEAMEDYEQCEREACWLVEKYPDCKECRALWISSAASANLLAVGLQRSHFCIERWPNDPDFISVAETLPEVDEEIRNDIEELCPLPANYLDLVAANERADFLLRYARFDEAIDACLNTLKEAPDFLPIRNTLATCRWEIGEIEEARRDFLALLDVSRTPIVALGGLARIAMLQGRHAEAKELARRMPVECGYGWSTVIAFHLGVVGDFERLRDYHQELEAAAVEVEPISKHYAAVAYAQLGNTPKAIKLWKEALQEEPDLTVAASNLADLKEPAGSRNGPWLHSMNELIPTVMWQDICQVLDTEAESDDARLSELTDEWPELLNVAPGYLLCGEDFDRRLALGVLMLDPIKHREILLRFAGGQDGRDEIRAGIYYYLSQGGLLSPGRYKFWHKGKSRNLSLHELKSLNSVAGIEPPESADIEIEALRALEEGRLEEARDGFIMALGLDPGAPTVRNNLAAVYRELGDRQKYVELISELFDDYPEYLFARTNMAQIQMDEGNLDAARGLLNGISLEDTFRPTEYEAVYGAMIRLSEMERDPAEALRWLDALEQAVPDSEIAPTWREKLKPARRARPAPRRKKS